MRLTGQGAMTMSNSPLTLILGGARSGKTRYGETLITALPAPWAYIATAEIFDDEMEARIERHRADRTAAGWVTIETPLEIWTALETSMPVLVDCLTLWVSNLMHSKHDIESSFARLENALAERRAPTFLIGNEVGLGIVPDNAMAREFRDHAGRLHQRLANRADHVFFMVAGLPMRVK